MGARSGQGARRLVPGLVAGGLLLALAAPAYLAYARPDLAAYLLHPWIFVIQALPYAIAALLWVPGWGWMSDRGRVVLAALLFATSLLTNTPVLVARWGGDMVALVFVALTGVTLAVVALLSGVVALREWVRRRTNSLLPPDRPFHLRGP